MLSLEKTKITNLHKDKVKFLGVYFIIPKPKESKIVLRKLKNGKKTKMYARVNHVHIKFILP